MHNKCGITQSTRVASTSCRQKTYKENVRCIVTETTLSLLISQRSLCCMLCGRRKVRMTKVQLSASSWHIQPGRNEQQWQRRATVCCQRGQTLPESQARESALCWTSQAAITLPFLSQLALLGLLLFQEQDIMYFYYACHYHSVHKFLVPNFPVYNVIKMYSYFIRRFSVFWIIEQTAIKGW